MRRRSSGESSSRSIRSKREERGLERKERKSQQTMGREELQGKQMACSWNPLRLFHHKLLWAPERRRSSRMLLLLLLIGVLMFAVSFIKQGSPVKDHHGFSLPHAPAELPDTSHFLVTSSVGYPLVTAGAAAATAAVINGRNLDTLRRSSDGRNLSSVAGASQLAPLMTADQVNFSAATRERKQETKRMKKKVREMQQGVEQPLQEPKPELSSALALLPAVEQQLWEDLPAEGLEQCIKRTKKERLPAKDATNGYLLVTANGGLNQMRAAICDMVAVARIMNAILVLPKLDHSSFWADPSEFSDIFDVANFISELKDDVWIVKKLPRKLRSIVPLEVFPVSWSRASYYKKRLLPLLQTARVMQFPLTDSRLSNNDVPASIQRLRCRANYKALKYTPAIDAVANNLIARLRAIGPYIALHLRYEKDMLAFTGCTHGLTEGEAEELRVMRNNVSRWKEKDIDGEARRKEGACPFTPRETALFLKALGFPNRTLIYIAAGEIYGSHGLKSLFEEFPNTHTHATLATMEELQLLGTFQNRLAAVDHKVAVESNVFMYTYEGNMAKIVQGHRRFEGHRKTIIPDRRLVIEYIDQFDAGLLTWQEFATMMRIAHKNRMGRPHLREKGEDPKLEENFFANPYPGCLCGRHKISSLFPTREPS